MSLRYHAAIHMDLCEAEGDFIFRLLRTLWRGLAIVLLSPTRYSACALAWWIAGLGVLSLMMEAGLNPQSRNAAFMKWAECLGPLTLIAYVTLGFGFIGGPWCLLYHFLADNRSGDKNAKRRALNQQQSGEA